jgi:hypothetical protein
VFAVFTNDGTLSVDRGTLLDLKALPNPGVDTLTMSGGLIQAPPDDSRLDRGSDRNPLRNYGLSRGVKQRLILPYPPAA